MGSRSSHQTVRLSAGSHQTAEEGACVVELASMLTREPFSDRPRSVCPALRAFLHGYNDHLPDDVRQQLYGLASDIAWSRTSPQVTAWRARLCVDWARSLAAFEGVSPHFADSTLANCARAGAHSARLAGRDSWCHRQTVAFVRWLAHAYSPMAANGVRDGEAPGEPGALRVLASEPVG